MTQFNRVVQQKTNEVYPLTHEGAGKTQANDGNKIESSKRVGNRNETIHFQVKCLWSNKKISIYCIQL